METVNMTKFLFSSSIFGIMFEQFWSAFFRASNSKLLIFILKYYHENNNSIFL